MFEVQRRGLTSQAPPFIFDRRFKEDHAVPYTPYRGYGSNFRLASQIHITLFALIFLFAVVPCAIAQSANPALNTSSSNHSNGAKTKQGRKANDPQVELEKRLSASREALQSGDPESIKAASQKVIAFGLQQIAELRMVEGAFPQAIELYQQSLGFEDVPYKHLRLSLGYLQAKKPDDALGEAQKVLFSDPENAIAWRFEGSAWMQRKDYARAAGALAHSLKLQGDSETAYNLAICFLAQHQKDKAQLVFDDIAKNLGDTGNVHLMFGRAYREQNYPEDAEREFRRSIAVDPKSPHAHYFLGLLLLMRNEWMPTQEVRDLFRAELNVNQKDYLTNYLLGMFASNEKRYDESDRYLAVAAEGFPDWPEPPLYMGLNAYGRQDYKAAEALIRKAIRITGNDESRSDYDIRRGYIALGRIDLATGRKQDAEADFAKSRQLLETALKASQQNVSSILASEGGNAGMGAVVPLLEKRQEQQAISDEYFGTVADEVDLSKVKLSDDEKQEAEQEERYLRQVLGSSFNDLGASEAHMGEFAAALNHFQKAASWDADIAGVNRNVGVAAFKVGNYPVAIVALSKQVDQDPQDSAAREMLGMSYFSTNDFRNAAKAFTPLGESPVSEVGIAYPWALSLAKIGETKQSAAILTALEKRQLQPETLFLIGQVWSEIGDYPRAVQVFHRALALNPQLPKAHYSAGIACIYQGHLSEAEAELESELKLFPNDDDAKYNLAFSYLLQSERAKAIELLKAVVASNPSHADAQYQLGKIMLDDGKVAEAVSHLEQAERASPEKDYVHYQLQAAYRKEARLQDAERELQLYKETKARHLEKSLPRPSDTPNHQ
jgi:tetratricopeptide (TPR) repeat protein